MKGSRRHLVRLEPLGPTTQSIWRVPEKRIEVPSVTPGFPVDRTSRSTWTIDSRSLRRASSSPSHSWAWAVNGPSDARPTGIHEPGPVGPKFVRSRSDAHGSPRTLSEPESMSSQSSSPPARLRAPARGEWTSDGCRKRPVSQNDRSALRPLRWNLAQLVTVVGTR
jgi:hypothetical protein